MGDNICQTCLTKDWYPRYVKYFCNSIIRQVTQDNMGKGCKQIHTKDYIQIANEHIKKHPTSLVIREI